MNGSCMWVCVSMPPGITYLPAASITLVSVGTSAEKRTRYYDTYYLNINSSYLSGPLA